MNLHMLQVELWRGDATGVYRAYDVPSQTNQTVLDIVTWVQRHIDSTLAYRFACRVGMCGSCAMTVNGRPRWTCRTHVAKVVDNGQLRIGPLENLPVIRDLVTDMSNFFDKWQRAGGRFESTRTRRDPIATLSPARPERRAADGAIECINCGVCYAACDVVRWRPKYLGPAALNRAWAAYNDTRASNRRSILSAVTGDAGCHSCHTQQSCFEHCPVDLNPAAAIAGLKRASLFTWLTGRSPR